MKYIIFLLLSVFILGCEAKGEKEAGTLESSVKLRNKKIVRIMETTFPFSETKKIEIISYPVRFNWDTLTNVKDGVGTRLRPLLKDKKLNVNPVGINDRIVLNEKHKRQLFNFLFIDQCPKDYIISSCFDARHCILFYDKKNEIFAHIEVCLDCSVAHSSGFEFNEICSERINDLGRIFKDAGVTYFGENDKL
jgi:hypothetical protein